MIRQLQNMRTARFEPLRGQSAAFKAGNSDATLMQLWREAQDAKEMLRDNISILSQFSKSGNASSNSIIRQALESATEKMRILSDILR